MAIIREYDPPYGAYILVNLATVSDPSTVYVEANGTQDGSNMVLGPYHNSTAQVFYVERWDDGDYRIVSRYTGKVLDVYGQDLQAGGNVCLYRPWPVEDTLNNPAQRWRFWEVGTSVTFMGQTLSKLWISPQAASDSLCMGVANTADGTNVQLFSRANTERLEWILYPVPPFTSGGVYSVRSAMDTSLAWTAGGSSNGSNVSLAAYNGTNSQKWFVDILEGTGNQTLYIRNIESRRNVEVDAASVAGALGKNIRIANEDLSRLQTWLPVDMGERTYDGKQREVMHFKLLASTGGTDHLAAAVDWDGKRNVFCNGYTGDGYQMWVLFEEDATDPNMPVPDIKGAANTVKGTRYTDLADKTGTLKCYPGWTCTDAWATDGPNHYEYRWRTRFIRNKDWKWTAWGSWSTVRPATVVTSGNDAWLSNGHRFDYDPDAYGVAEVQMQVRTVSDETDEDFKTGSVHSAWGAAQFRSIYKPTVTMGTTAVNMLDGIMLTFTSNYRWTNMVHLDSVMVGGRELLVKPMRNLKFNGTSGSVVIPVSNLRSVPARNARLTVRFGTGTPGCVRFGDVAYQTGTATMSYEGGNVTPALSIADGEGYTTDVRVTDLGTTRLYVSFNGRTVPARLVASRSGYATYGVCLPFGVEAEVVACSRNAAGTKWYSVSRRFTYEPPRRAHVWNFDGGWAQVMLADGEPGLVTSHSFEGDYERMVLNAREHETVTFGETVKSAWDVEGVGIPNVEHSTHDDFYALVEAHYATYRSPRGQMCEVAVLGAKTDERPDWIEVSVEMVEVTQ